MTVNHTAVLPVLKTMWAEIKNQFVVIWKHSNPQVDDVRKFIYGLGVCVSLAGMRNWENNKHYISANHFFQIYDFCNTSQTKM